MANEMQCTQSFFNNVYPESIPFNSHLEVYLFKI